MGDVIAVVPTITFSHAPLPSQVHLPVHEDAVVTGTHDVTVVTTLCGFVGIGVVKLRRAPNCGECIRAAGLTSYT